MKSKAKRVDKKSKGQYAELHNRTSRCHTRIAMAFAVIPKSSTKNNKSRLVRTSWFRRLQFRHNPIFGIIRPRASYYTVSRENIIYNQRLFQVFSEG